MIKIKNKTNLCAKRFIFFLFPFFQELFIRVMIRILLGPNAATVIVKSISNPEIKLPDHYITNICMTP